MTYDSAAPLLPSPSPLGDIIDVVSDAVVNTDTAGRIVYWNRKAEKLFEYSKPEAIGELLAEICPAPTVEERVLLGKCLDGGEGIREFRTHRISKHGKRIAVTLSVVPICDATGRRGGAAYVFEPAFNNESATVQALRQVAQLKRAQGESFRAFTDAVADMLWAADAAGDETYLGARFAGYLGSDIDDLQGRTWLSLVHPDDQVRIHAAWSMALRTGERFEAETQLRRFDGVYRWFVLRAVPLLDDDNRISEWIGSCTDIDDLKRSEQTLLRSNEELKQFAFAAAHDLQEPLRNVATSVGMLQRYFRGQLDDAAAQYMEASIEGAQRLHAMVKDLLTFSTILDNAQHLRGGCSLAVALSKAIARASSAIAENGAQIEAGNLPDVAVHEDHASQLFHNLIENSLKYRDPMRAPVISISAAAHESRWLISVRDNGIGFEPAYARLIFRVFKRLHQRNEYAGNGIGLAICERIVAHYGGRIWAEGWPGEGAAFHFTLPAYSAAYGIC